MFLKNLSIKKKLYVLISLPIVAVSYFVFSNIYNHITLLNNYNMYKNNLSNNLELVELIKKLEDERDFSGIYILSNGENSSLELNSLREKVNKFFEKKSFQTLSQSFVTNYKNISKVRRKIDNKNIEFNVAVEYYNSLLNSLISTLAINKAIFQDYEISKEEDAFYDFVNLKQYSSLERVLGLDIYKSKAYNQFSYDLFLKSVYSQKILVDKLQNNSNIYTLKEILDDNLNSFNSLEQMRNTLLSFDRKISTLYKIEEIINNEILNNLRNYILIMESTYKLNGKKGLLNLEKEIIKYSKFKELNSNEKLLLSNLHSFIGEIKNKYEEFDKEIKKEAFSFKKIDTLAKVDIDNLKNNMHYIKNSFLSTKIDKWFIQYSKRLTLLNTLNNTIEKDLLNRLDEKIKSIKNNITLTIIILLFIALSLFIIMLRIERILSKGIESIYIGTEHFMKYMNKEINELEYINYKSKDELGQLATMINKNIDKINGNLEKDLLCVGEATITLDKIEKGYYSCRVISKAANPQIRTLAKTINKMLDVQEEVIGSMLKILDKYINYDYLEKIEINNISGDSKKMVNGINYLGEAITKMLIENRKNGKILKASSMELLNNVDKLNDSSNDAAVKLEEVSASIEEITTSIGMNTENISKMSSNAKELSNSAVKGESLANETVSSMKNINTQVDAINEAIEVIDQISFQTNILSLNAAVEAATAGEAGKGFAVVAQEVRNLATRSAEAAKEIKELVENANKKSSQGINIADEMIKGYNILSKNIKETLCLIDDVNASSLEQKSNIEQINDAINSLDAQTQDNANIASITHDIALKTQNIATKIVEDTNNKKFKD